ncbi:LytTR family DNA-binding domain-containing protein [Staphylococcus argensis]|uniref:LytTR family transcriptional regulator n=1 Tax=Staphylococcus argensis TaxID=1607738 RepID=A0A2K4FB58_9STAP|nr:LytTR family DNA-binding domain-containing protein [Staphylococcus argensis]MCY6991778.1 LytTR family transcriptional regulator [Staphylococcus argensis]POA08579.1 LytTR family transcriptional regulator [Staphylococcus argensis]
MKLRLNIGNAYPEECVSIEGPEMTEEIQQLVSYVDDLGRLTEIKGSIEDDIYFLNVKDIRSFMSLNKKIYAYTRDTEYSVAYRLYELESALPTQFVRISKSEIVNIDAIYKLQLQANGLIRIYFNNIDYTHSSRRYLKMIKERLSL